MTKSKKVNNSPKTNSNIDSAILDQLMADYNPANPESLIGKDGLYQSSPLIETFKQNIFEDKILKKSRMYQDIHNTKSHL